ncbi:DUF4191 domain-containing protein [Mariniluteicoccus flavus]
MAEQLSAKERQAQAKAAAKAEKLRRKNSTDPADMGRVRQIREAYRLTHEYDKPLPWIMAACFFGPILLVALVLALWQPGWFTGVMVAITGVMLGLLLALWVLTLRTKKATYARYMGQAGSAEVALQMLGNKWIHDPVIAMTRHKDVVHRAIGPAGIVLVSEGDPHRAKQLLLQEKAKHEKFSGLNVVVHTIQMGEGSGQVPLSKLTEHVKKLPKALEAFQITEVKSRLRAVDAVRPKAPIPRGPVPTSMKGSRKGMRGR